MRAAGLLGIVEHMFASSAPPSRSRERDHRSSGHRAAPRPGQVPGSLGKGDRQLLTELGARARPVSPASSRLVPVLEPLRRLFPDAAMRRGSTVVVAGAPGLGATTLALSLLAAASARGSWCAAIGLTDPGVVAMAELGVDLRRVVFVPTPEARWAEAVGELLGGVDVVTVRLPGRTPLTAARRLAARARERQAVMVVLGTRPGDWPLGPDLVLRVRSAEWCGPDGGHGHLRGRRVEVEASGRGPAARPTSHLLWLPAAEGAAADDRAAQVAAADDRAAQGAAVGLGEPAAGTGSMPA